MNKDKRRFMDGCFCGNWVDFDVKQNPGDLYGIKTERRRKDLQTLLEELEEIKRNFERIAEKQAFLDSLIKFNEGEFAEGQT